MKIHLSGGGILALIAAQLYTTYTTSCASSVPDHQCSDCVVPEFGRVRSIAFIDRSFIFSDPTNPAQWASGIALKKIIIIPATRGTYDGGSEILAQGYGDQVQKLTGYNHKLNYIDPSYIQNADFYNAIRTSQNYYMAYRTSSQIHIVNPTVQVVPKNPVTDSLTDEVTWAVDVLWADINSPVPYNAPAGTFTCFSYN